MTLRATICIGAAMTVIMSGAYAAPVQRGPVDTGPGSLAAARRFLEGRWGLISYEFFPPGKPPIRLRGEGTLTYDGFGNLDMEIRVDEPTARLLEDAGIPTTKGVLSTRGRTAIDLQAHTLTYFLEGQPAFGAPSGPIALNRPRHWQVEGNVLTLTTRDADGQALSVSRWQKGP